MKKIYALLMVMLGFLVQTVCAETLLTPDPAKTYMIQHSSGLFLTVDGNSAKIMPAGAGDSQKFTVTPVEGAEATYNIKLEDGRYFGSDSGWTVIFMDDPSDAFTQYTFWQSTEPDHFKMFNEGRQGYVGTDQNSEGAGVYTNKSGNDGKHAWKFVEATDGVIYDALTNAISSAQSALEGIEIGAEPGMYPQEAVDVLNAAIATAQGFLTSQDQLAVNEAAKTLNEAISTFAAQRIVFNAQEGKQYVFVNIATNFVMGMTDTNEAALQSPTGNIRQKFEIVPVEGCRNAFNLKLADGSGFLTRKGGWNTTVGTDATADVAKFEFEISDLANSVYRLKKFREWGYCATDGTTEGSLVYTDKDTRATSNWKVVLVEEGQLLTFGLEASIANAEKFIAEVVVGTQPGMYPQSAVDALSAALATAKAATYTTQDEVNAITATLNEAINAFLAAEIDPWFEPLPNTAYRFSVRKYNTKFLTNNGTDAKTTSEFESGKTAQHWTFQPVEGLEHTFIVKNDGKALSYDGTVSEVADADALKWTVVYCRTIDDLDYFALVEYDNPTQVVTFGGGNNFAIQNLDKGSNAHQARFLRVDPANDPYLYDLEYAVAKAKAALKSVTRGNELGQWSDAKCDAFQAIITAAETLIGATQEEVDAKVTELNEARVNFLQNPNTVNKDAIDAALAAAKEKAAAAQIGVNVGEYYPRDIEAFEARIAGFEESAKTVSEQEAADALAAEIVAATEAFTGNTEVQAAGDVLADVIRWCEALYEAEKDNVGDNKGQRPQSVVDAFKAAIDAAKAVTEAQVTDIEALLDARYAFLNGAVSIDRTPLRKAIQKAEAEPYTDLKGGDFDGYYPQNLIDTFNAALTAAKEAEADMSKTQEEINACTNALNDAMVALDRNKVVISFTALDAAIEAADQALAKAVVIGSEPGQCPQSVVDALKNVIDAAKAIDRAAINQTNVDAKVTELNEAVVTFRTELVNSTGITAAITSAQAVLAGATEGFKPGNYPASATAALSAAIAAAQEIASNDEAAQADLIQAVQALNQAVETFKATVIPPHDLTEIKALIAEAEAFIAETKTDDFTLNMMLAEAREIVADADNHTKSEIQTACDNLRKALDFAKQSSGVSGFEAQGVSIESKNGALVVSGLRGECTVMVFNMDGRLMSNVRTVGSEYSVSLAAGCYVVAIQGEGYAARKVIVVK